MASGSSDSEKPWLFKPGQSGNPGGLPKAVAELKAKFIPYGPEALERLVTIMRVGSDKNAAYAAVEILNRILGRAPQAITGDEGGPIQVAGVLELLKRLGEGAK